MYTLGLFKNFMCLIWMEVVRNTLKIFYVRYSSFTCDNSLWWLVTFDVRKVK